MADMTKEEAVKAVREHFRNRSSSLRPNTYLWPYSHAGLVLTSHGISARPGGYPLAWWFDETIILGLDFALDLDDESMNRLRDIVFTGMEEEGVDFISMSHNAFSRLNMDTTSLQPVDRVGMQCVFSGIQRLTKIVDGYRDTAVSDRRYYLSGYDANETPPLYFLARLPHEVESYKDAIEALKPESVKLAEAKGLEVLRQGDMFAIPTKYNTNDLKKMGADIRESIDYPVMIRRCSLYGTAHCTEKMARLPDGTQLGRGVMMHRPLGRPADHRDLPLSPAKWYIIVKNTVPVEGS